MLSPVSSGAMEEVCDEFITWKVKDFDVLWRRQNKGFVDISPSFYMPDTGECEWQFELVCSNKYGRVSDASPSLRYIELKLRLIQNDQSKELFRKPFSVIILCYLHNTDGEYHSVFHNRETFCMATNTSWCSQKIDGLSLMKKLNGGELTIRSKLELITFPTCEVPAHKISLGIHENLKKMFKERILTDIALVDIEGKETHAHQCVLACRCPIFNDWLQMEPSVINSRRIQTEMNQEELGEFVGFIYTGMLSSALCVALALRLFEVSLAYRMPDLKKVCEDKLISNLNVINCLDILIFADQQEELCLKNRALAFISNNREKFLEEDSFIVLDNNLRLLKDITDYTTESCYTPKQCIS